MNSEKIKKYKKLLIQFVKFGIVGVSNSVVMLTVYYLVLWINSDMYLLGNFLGYMLGILNAYFWNSRFVFKNPSEKKSDKKVLLRVYISYGITLLIQTVLLYLMVNVLLVNDKIAPLINIVITTPINFVLNKLWAFKERNTEKGGKQND